MTDRGRKILNYLRKTFGGTWWFHPGKAGLIGCYWIQHEGLYANYDARDGEHLAELDRPGLAPVYLHRAKD